MSLSETDNALLKDIYRALDPLEAIEPDSPRYVRVFDRPGAEDLVAIMRRRIELASGSSMQLFSGFRGAGKTTELFRLRSELKARGMVVLYADALDYVNPFEPLDITSLLVTIAGAFGDAIEILVGKDPKRESWGLRLLNYLKETNLELDQFGIKVGPGVDLKGTLKTTPSFRQKLEQHLQVRIGGLTAQVAEFFDDGVKILRKKSPDAPVVFLFDSLEQIRGSIFSEAEVVRSVERVFSQHLGLLAIPAVHVVYTVPPWLKFVAPNTAALHVLPSVRQWENDSARTPYEAGNDILRSVATRRLIASGQDQTERFFGAKNVAGRYELLERLIEVCGGQFRNLFELMREVLVRTQSLPVNRENVDDAINAVRQNFRPIALADAQWLDRIGEQRSAALSSTDPAHVTQLARFLDNRMVLFLKNGGEWYDLHPLVREEVAEIVKREHQSQP